MVYILHKGVRKYLFGDRYVFVLNIFRLINVCSDNKILALNNKMSSYAYLTLMFQPQLICERMLFKVILRHAGKKQRASNNKE